jgi:hypothetical protein
MLTGDELITIFGALSFSLVQEISAAITSRNSMTLLLAVYHSISLL